MDESRAANALTLAGAIPFVVFTLLTIGEPHVEERVEVATVILMLYSAVILSFLGGIRFGMEVRAPGDGAAANIAWSVIPSLAGWGLVVLTYIVVIFGASGFVGWAFALFALLFALQYAWDAASVRAGEAPGWFAGLRRRITLIVVPTLLVAAVIAWSHY